MNTHDLIGIGFGPSNVALAIALHESDQRLSTLFIDSQPTFAWHPHMMLNDAHMQVSFLKDLATLRNPCSRFTFVSYLHKKRRLPDFINLKTFFPSRKEFNDYLSWAAGQFEDCCAFGEEVVEVQPQVRDGEVKLLQVRSRENDGSIKERLARNLVVSVGGTANWPGIFQPLRTDARVFHSSTYLRNMADRNPQGRIAVIGAGQSASELFMDLHGRSGDTSVDLIMRGRAIRPSDDSPFVNEIFNADFTDFIFNQPDSKRAALVEEYRQTNYAAPDLALIEQIFKVFYEQRVSGAERHRFLRRTEVRSVHSAADGVHLTVVDLNSGVESTMRYDTVVLATGYHRERHKSILAPLADYLGDYEVDRNYRLLSAPSLKPRIFIQGACEGSHGLSDTLLSVTALRTGEIVDAIAAGASRQFDERRLNA